MTNRSSIAKLTQNEPIINNFGKFPSLPDLLWKFKQVFFLNSTRTGNAFFLSFCQNISEKNKIVLWKEFLNVSISDISVMHFSIMNFFIYLRLTGIPINNCDFPLFTEVLVRRCSVKKAFLKMSQNSQVFSCEFCETFKNTFFFWWLLLFLRG